VKCPNCGSEKVEVKETRIGRIYKCQDCRSHGWLGRKDGKPADAPKPPAPSTGTGQKAPQAPAEKPGEAVPAARRSSRRKPSQKGGASAPSSQPEPKPKRGILGQFFDDL
jgi:hypothetical protein